MELPFDGGGKPMHVDFVDAVHDLSVKMNYKTNLSWDAVQQNAISAGVKRALDCVESEDTNQEIVLQWVEMNEAILDRSLFSERYIRDERVPDGIIPLDFFYENDALHEYGKDGFSDEGWDLLKKQLPKIVTKILEEGWRNERMFDVMRDSMNKNNGLIDCWRAIVLNENVDDVFAEVTQKYKGVGLYWSWSHGAAHPYNGVGNLSSRVDAILHAKVRPEDVDWARTVYVNVYDLREEQELSIKGHVQLDRIELRNAKGASSVELGGLVVPVGYQGSWTKYK